MQVCFEIPKNADHFKVVYSHNLGTSGTDPNSIVGVFDKLSISTTEEQKAPEQKAPEQKIAELETESETESGGGCLIATATFGSEMAPQVQFLRELRDNTVLQTESGTSFMTGFNQFYYSFSPYIADYEREIQHSRRQ